jgi:hypothetical protein
LVLALLVCSLVAVVAVVALPLVAHLLVVASHLQGIL